MEAIWIALLSALPPTLVALAAVIIASKTLKEIEEIHRKFNRRIDELLAVTRNLSQAWGVEQPVEQLVADLLGGEERFHLADGEERAHASVGTGAVANSRFVGAPAPAKTAPTSPAHKTPPVVADDAPPRVARKYWVVLSVCALTWGVWYFLGASPPLTPSQLVATAISGSAADDRLKAAVLLTMVKEPQVVVPSLRCVVAESQDAEVLACATDALSSRNDGESFAWYLAAMEHVEKKVREAGFKALLKYYGGALPENIEYNVDGSKEEQAAAVNRLKEYVQKQKADQERRRQTR